MPPVRSFGGPYTSAAARARYIGRPDSLAQQLRATIQSVIADQGRLIAVAQLIEQQRRVPFDRALAQATAAACAMAVSLLALATWRLRRTLTA